MLPAQPHSHVILLSALVALPLLALAAPQGCQSMTCEERVDAAYDYIYTVLDANQSCNVDADCTTANIGTECMGMCPVTVSVSGLEAVNDAVDYANQTWCEDFMADGCPYATPSCAGFEPVCGDDGLCTMSYL